MKLFIGVKRTYADFDIPIEEPLFVGPEDVVRYRISKLNEKRTKDEIRNETEYKCRKIKYIEH